MNHRGKAYEKIHSDTVTNLRAILGIPAHFKIGFLSSATEIWERMGENLMEKSSCHLINGAFSEKFYQAVNNMGKTPEKVVVEPGTCADVSSLEIADHAELIALAQNETSTGVAMPLSDIKEIRKRYPEPLLVVDAVSAVPIPKFDFDTIDSLYFSVQKGFGLPAGLGVWAFNERCIEKAQKLKEKGKYHQTFNGILNIDKFANKNQTPCTPNVLNIYLLGQVANDMLVKGIDQIRTESKYKSALIYQLFETHPKLNPFVKEKRFRSPTVCVAEVEGGSEALLKKLKDLGFQIGNGYGQFKNQHIRIANFPTHSREQLELLVDTINDLEF